jgi:hypothetical protein
MRYLQRQLLNKKQVIDYGIAVGIGGDVVINSTNNVLLPKGTTAERPVTPANGMIRYNTTTSEVEVYQGSAWRSLRYKEGSTITLQSLGFGDGSTTIFGPLSPTPPSIIESGGTWGGQHLIVLVENVIQIFNTNYTIVQNPGGPYVAGYYIQFTGPSIPNKPINVLHGFDR